MKSVRLNAPVPFQTGSDGGAEKIPNLTPPRLPAPAHVLAFAPPLSSALLLLADCSTGGCEVDCAPGDAGYVCSGSYIMHLAVKLLIYAFNMKITTTATSKRDRIFL